MPFDYKKASEIIGQLGKTQQQIADAIGMQRSNLARLLAGNVENPTLKTLESLAEALQVPLFTLVTKSEKKN